MEFEERNKKPVDTERNLPLVVLITLVSIVGLLLFVGWKMLSDEASTVEELSDNPVQKEIIVSEDTIQNAQKQEDFTSTEETFPPAKMEVVVSEEKEDPKKEPSVSVSQSEIITHTIAPKETFFSIATRYNLSQATLKSYNPNISPDNLKANDKLKIPVMAVHTVGPGDILKVVAKKYNVSVSQIMKANNKTRNFAERGEKLIIPNPVRQ